MFQKRQRLRNSPHCLIDPLQNGRAEANDQIVPGQLEQ